MNLTNNTETLLARIAEALERLSLPLAKAPDFSSAEAFVWRAETQILAPVKNVSRVDIALLRGVDFLRDQLVGNTERFARGPTSAARLRRAKLDAAKPASNGVKGTRPPLLSALHPL